MYTLQECGGSDICPHGVSGPVHGMRRQRHLRARPSADPILAIGAASYVAEEHHQLPSQPGGKHGTVNGLDARVMQSSGKPTFVDIRTIGITSIVYATGIRTEWRSISTVPEVSEGAPAVRAGGRRSVWA